MDVCVYSSSLCVFQVNEIYQDTSLGANINVVLVRIIMLSPSKVTKLLMTSSCCKVVFRMDPAGVTL